MSRARQLALNSISSVVLQITTIGCGLVLPRLILKNYGSDINGLVNSISQFLSVITLMDMGVGAVVKSSLYRPLADNNNDLLSKVYLSATNFFRKVAGVFFIYIVFLFFGYPTLIYKQNDYLFSGVLILSIGISRFSEYYIGIVNRILIIADQKGYIYYCIQTLSLLLNTIISVILIQKGFSIQFVKVVSSIIFLFRPIFLHIYVEHCYTIDKGVVLDCEPIAQKWNGIAQHLSAFVLDGTDIIILTFFSSLSNVSIYSVYNMIIISIKNFFISITNGFETLVGEMYAKGEIEALKDLFSFSEWVIHTVVTLVFGCATVLIVSFVRVYTIGITDINYENTLFGLLITLAGAAHCIRLPYNILILSAGHYKETQWNYIMAMLINILLSIIMVNKYGLIGVAIGTLVALIYQTIWMAWYNSKAIIYYPFIKFLKQFFVDLSTIITGFVITRGIQLGSDDYLSWIAQGIKVFCVWVIIIFGINYIFYKNNIFKIVNLKI